MENPVVFSVVVPNYNRLEQLEEAILSVIGQTFSDWELIIIDDASEISLAPIIAKYESARVIFLRQEKNEGASAARNRGIDAARGKYIAFLDSDDQFLPDSLQTVFRKIEEYNFTDEDHVCISSRYQLHTSENSYVILPKVLLRDDEDVMRYLFVSGGRIRTSTIVVSKSCAQRARFDTKMIVNEDYDFVRRLQKQSVRFVMIPDALVKVSDKYGSNRLSRDKGAFKTASNWITSIQSQLAPDVVAAFMLRELAPIAQSRTRRMGIFAENVLPASSMKFKSKCICLVKCLSPDLFRGLKKGYVRIAR